MKTYIVTFVETVRSFVRVEAESPEGAAEHTTRYGSFLNDVVVERRTVVVENVEEDEE